MTEAVRFLTPEIVLVAAAAAIYLGGAFVHGKNVWVWAALLALVLAGGSLANSALGNPLGTVHNDGLALFVRSLGLGLGVLLVLLAWRPLDWPGTSEYLASLLLAVAGVMLVGAANDLVLVFLGLELVSIPTYVMLYLARRDASGQEATAKYFFLSVLASAVALYGFSFLYGAAGTTDLASIAQRLDGSPLARLAPVAMILILAGLSFRLTAVPFHFYAPDVYQGTSHANAAFLSVMPKLAGLAALVRLISSVPQSGSYLWWTVLVVAALSMTLGNLVALWQSNLRRLLAYSSIAHSGYILVGLTAYLAVGAPVATGWGGLGALWFYLLVYAVATVGTFAVLECLRHADRPIDDVEELAGLAWSGGWVRPLVAWLLAAMMLSLTGIPIMAGFWGKLAVFFSALSVPNVARTVQGWLVALAVLGVLNSAIGAAYYLRIVGTMFFRMPLATQSTRSARGALVAAALCGILVLLIGLRPGPWVGGANLAVPVQAPPQVAATR